jgi:hypothetical protein
MIAAAFAQLEKARLAKKLKAARDRGQQRLASTASVLPKAPLAP